MDDKERTASYWCGRTQTLIAGTVDSDVDSNSFFESICTVMPTNIRECARRTFRISISAGECISIWVHTRGTPLCSEKG